MIPYRVIPDALTDYWAGYQFEVRAFDAPEGMTDCAPCPAVVTQMVMPDESTEMVVRVPWELEAGDLELLAAGGTIWLSTWGGLPPHQLEVAP